MKNLINFLIKYSVMFLFLLLEIISLALIIRNEGYQRSVFLSSSNSVVSGMYEMSNSVVEFFKLKTANANLSEENTELKNRIVQLQNELATLNPEVADTFRYEIPPEKEYQFISAKAISNSTNKIQNYMTINKGTLQGVYPDMGVVNNEGVVGIVKTVSDRFATVIPILNPKFQISTKIVRSKYSGTLRWPGYDYRYAELYDIARHVEVHEGDTLVTSGLTKMFPEGIPLGIIEEVDIKESDSYYKIKVKLAVNFRTLSHVDVIKNRNYQEQKDLEEKNKE